MSKVHVKFTQNLSGLNSNYHAGQIVELPTKNANEYISAGVAEKVEKATVQVKALKGQLKELHELETANLKVADFEDREDQITTLQAENKQLSDELEKAKDELEKAKDELEKANDDIAEMLIQDAVADDEADEVDEVDEANQANQANETEQVAAQDEVPEVEPAVETHADGSKTKAMPVKKS